jgi:hypothetical protein
MRYLWILHMPLHDDLMHLDADTTRASPTLVTLTVRHFYMGVFGANICAMLGRLGVAQRLDRPGKTILVYRGALANASDRGRVVLLC